MLTQVLPNYQQSIERTAALLDLIKKQNLHDVSFEIENIMPAIKTEEDKQKDGDIDPTIAFEQMGNIVEKAPEAPTHETHYGWKGRIGEVPDYDWMRENIERVCNRPVHQIVDFGERSPEEIYMILGELAQNLSRLIQTMELGLNEDSQKLTKELSKSLDSARSIKDKNNLAKTIVDTLKELDNIRDNLSDEQAMKLREDIDAIYTKIPRITRVATTYEDSRDAVRETANKLKSSRAELNWSWAEPEQVVAVGHLKE